MGAMQLEQLTGKVLRSKLRACGVELKSLRGANLTLEMRSRGGKNAMSKLKRDSKGRVLPMGSV